MYDLSVVAQPTQNRKYFSRWQNERLHLFSHVTQTDTETCSNNKPSPLYNTHTRRSTCQQYGIT